MLFVAKPSPILIDQGPFKIRVACPGMGVPDTDDHGHGALAAVCESWMAPGTLIRMHEHAQDEIISWVPRGIMRHDDRTQGKLITDPDHLMVMNAGRSFWHEEETLKDDPPLRMLQIFVRPHTLDLEPRIQHGPLPNWTPNQWRHIVAPEEDSAPFFVRNRVHLHDIRLDSGAEVSLPARDGWDTYFFVFEGEVEAEGVRLDESETGLARAPVECTLCAREASLVVAFELDPSAPVTRRGTIGDIAAARFYQVMKRHHGGADFV